MAHIGALRGRFGFNTCLLVLTLATLIPVLAICGIAIIHAAISYKDTAIVRLTDTARTLASAIEADIEGRYTFLSVLSTEERGATSHKPTQLQPDRFEHVSLEGSIQYFQYQPSLVAAVDSPIATAQRAITEQKPVISNLSIGATPKDHRLSIALPVTTTQGDEEAIVLTTKPSQIIRTLQQSNHALSGMLVAVTDGNGRILARSRDAGNSVGRKAPDWDKLTALGTDSGWFEAVTTEGRFTVLAFQTLQGTPGWRIVVGEPLEVFNARWRQPLMALAIGGLIAVALAFALAYAIGRKIMRPVTALATRSVAIASGQAPIPWSEVPPSSIREFEILRNTAQAAENAQQEQERRLAAMAQAGALILWRWELNNGLVWIKGWSEITGLPDEAALGDAWMGHICPEDRPRLHEAFARLSRNQTNVEMEFRLRAKGRGWMWVRARGAPVHNTAGGLMHWAGVLEDIDERKQHEARIAYLAHHDVLTGLGNRSLLKMKLEDAVESAAEKTSGALLCLDLDRFKAVNDTYGHPVGDKLLCVVAQRLRSCVRDQDFIARVGGDEFNIIQRASQQPQAAASLAQRIIDTISQPYDIEDLNINIGTSVGITLLDKSVEDLDTYLQRADNALYRSKQNGRGQAQFFETDEIASDLLKLLRSSNPPGGASTKLTKATGRR